jgi:hypothetical protein
MGSGRLANADTHDKEVIMATAETGTRRRAPVRPPRPGDTAEAYLRWIDGTRAFNERLARVARVWIDETLGVQRDYAQTARRVIEEAFPAPAADAAPRTAGEAQPAGREMLRFADFLRSSAFLWTEAALKALERSSRVAGAAAEEVRAARAELAERIERRRGRRTRSSRTKAA